MRSRMALAMVVLLALSPPLPAAANDPKEEQAVLATLDAMARATVSKDLAALQRIYHDDLTYGHSDGETQTKSGVLQTVKARSWESMTFSNASVRVIGPVALVRNIMNVRNQVKTGGTNSAPTSWGNFANARTQVLWVLTKGQGPHGWQVVARQTTASRQVQDAAK